jgi:hypothetical protein
MTEVYVIYYNTSVAQKEYLFTYAPTRRCGCVGENSSTWLLRVYARTICWAYAHTLVDGVQINREMLAVLFRITTTLCRKVRCREND